MQVMNVLLDRTITAYQLRSVTGGSATSQHRKRRLSRAAEVQNWRCCYCKVRMFAGTPAEDLFYYAQSVGLRLINPGGGLNAAAFRHLGLLRVTVEHLIKQEVNGVGEAKNIAAACRWCNNQRMDTPPLVWEARVQELMRMRKHPHYKIVSNAAFLKRKQWR
jgi:hypothetical protein